MKKNKLPPYTVVTRYRYQYVPYTGGGRKAKRQTLILKDEQGKSLHPGAPLSVVWQAWERLQGKQTRPTLSWLLQTYLRSDAAAGLATNTRTEYTRQAAFIARYRPSLKRDECLGDVVLRAITPGYLRQYLDTRISRQKAPISGNREVKLISVAWSWALGRDYVRLPNPAKLVERNKEKGRDRYVTDEEYAQAFELAAEYRYLQPAMEFAYLLRLRQAEVRALRKSDISARGIDCKRLKGSRDSLTFWSDRLHHAVDLALSIDAQIDSVFLLHNGDGTPLTKPGFDSSWQRLKRRMRTAGIAAFNFHDLKAKGISDTIGDKQAAGGHRTAAMVALYDRKKPEVEPTR